MPEHARRIKIRRKALRQPDEFHTLTNQAMAWLDTHRELAAGIALALLVAAAAALEGPYRRDALLGEARLQEAGGQGDAAREIYARLLKESDPDPDLRTLLLSKLPPGTAAPPAARP